MRIAGSYQNQIYRTLEGKNVEETVGSLATASLQPADRAPGLVEYPIPWRIRLAGITISGNPPESWMLLRDDKRPGRTYLVGYELYSNERIGFLGQEGFCTSSPPKDERFEIGNRAFEWGSNLYASVGQFNTGSLGYSYNYDQSGPGMYRISQVFLCDGNIVRELDLRKREVRTIGEYDQLLGVAIVGIVLSESSDDATPSEKQPTTENRLLLRCSDRLILINTFESTEVEFKLPSDLIDKQLTVSTTGTNLLLLQVDRGYWEQGSVVDLLTLNPAGEIEQQDTVRLLGYVPDESPSQSLIPAGIVPSFLPWFVGILLVAPLVMLQVHQTDDFLQGIGKSWGEAWLGFLVVLAVSVILALVVNHLQKKYTRSHTRLWTTFVFLLGLPGLVAYWLHFREVPVNTCESCGKSVPRNRDICARCSEPFPESALRGTEIFA